MPIQPSSQSQREPINTDLITQIGHFGTAEFDEDLELTPESRAITPIMRQFALMRVRGYSISTAARKCNINQMTAQRWTNEPWFRIAFEEERRKVIDDSSDFRKELLAPLLSQALDALSSVLSSEDEKTRLAAVSLVFDNFFASKRGPGRPALNTNSGNTPIEDLSDLVSRAEERIANLNQSVKGNVIQLRANGTEG